jgi:hypothetical protein
MQLFGTLRGMHDASGDSFNAEAADGCKPSTAHGLRGEAGGELDEGERMDALAAPIERSDGEFVGGGASGSKDQDFGLPGVGGEKGGGALKEFGVRAAPEKRASGHT